MTGDMGEPVDPNSVPPGPSHWPQQRPSESPQQSPGPWGQQAHPGPPSGPYGGPQPYRGYPYPPYPSPGALRRATRPGQVLASAVLAFVLSGLLILAAILLMFGASTIDSFGDAIGEDTSAITAELVIDGLIDLVAAGLLIAGGVSLTGAGRTGRPLLASGAGITLAASIYWIARTSGAAGTIVYIVSFSALAIIAAALMSGPTVTGWLVAHRQRA